MGTNMKRLIPLLLFLLCSFQANAGMNAYIAGCGAASAACSNNASTDYVGDKIETSESGNLNADTMYCILYTPTMTCSTGTFSYAYARFTANDDPTKICIYEEKESDTEPGSGDTLVGCATVDSTEAGWAKSAAEVDQTATAAKSYWVCTVPSAGVTINRLQTDATDTVYSKAVESSYSSPPAQLDDSGWSTATRDYPSYVEVK